MHTLSFQPAIQYPHLLAIPVQHAVQSWIGTYSANDILVSEIDPKYMGGNELCHYYGLSPENGANCVIVEAVRGNKKEFAACLIPVCCQRADLNGVVRKYLSARRISLAPLQDVLRETQMEYGSITVVGLPKHWSILIDPQIINSEKIVMGSGLQKSKLLLPGKALLDLPNTHILEGICKEF